MEDNNTHLKVCKFLRESCSKEELGDNTDIFCLQQVMLGHFTYNIATTDSSSLLKVKFDMGFLTFHILVKCSN